MDRRTAGFWATISGVLVAIIALIVAIPQTAEFFHKYSYSDHPTDSSNAVVKPPHETNGSGVVHEDMLDNAFDLASGQIASDVANKMKEAKPEKVEVRIIRGVDQAMTQFLKTV